VGGGYFLDSLNQFLEKYQSKKMKPHKLILTYSIVKLIDEEPSHSNCFTFNEVERYFVSLYRKFFPEAPDYEVMLEYPFYHLQTDGFWFLKIIEGKDELFAEYKEKRFTKRRLEETIKYGFLDAKIFKYLDDKNNRLELISKIEKVLSNEKSYNLEDKDDYQLVVNETDSLFKHEEIAINRLLKSISPRRIGSLISNLVLYDKQMNIYLEYDVVLVTKFGVLVIELKHWSGNIQLGSHNWIVNQSHYRPDPHKSNSLKCKVLKGYYQHQFKTYPSIWVQSVVILTNQDANVEGALSPQAALKQDKGNLSFASIEDFISYVSKKEGISTKKLTESQVDNVATYFKSLNQPGKSIHYNVDGYETIEYIKQTPEFIELIARSLYSHVKGLIRFRVFRPPHDLSKEEKDRFLKIAFNTLSTVSEIGDHPYINKVFVHKNAEGDIIEQSEWSEAGTLQDYINMKGGAFSQIYALGLCAKIADALSAAHSYNTIHRAVKPSNILIKNDIPKLIDFDLSYRMEDDRITVINDVTKLLDDGYYAPELLFGDDIDEGTDYFSLGAIAYLLLTGIKPISSVRDYVSQGGELSQNQLEGLRKAGVPDEVIEVINKMMIADRDSRLKDKNRITDVLKKHSQQEITGETKVNQELQPGSRYDVYEIDHLIAKGADTQVYLARQGPKIKVALKLFNREVSRERIFKEVEIASSVSSTYVAHCGNRFGHWDGDRYFIIYDFVEGKTMRQWIEDEQGPTLELLQMVSICLMEAIASFHNHKDEEGNPQPFVHSDIKPENVIITNDEKAVLLDCGIAGEQRVDTFQGTTGYVPPDSIIGTDMQFSESADLFALGVTLWEWYFGSKPYENPSINDEPLWYEEYKEKTPDKLELWFKKAVATEADSRYSAVEEMKKDFISSYMEEEPSSLDKATDEQQIEPIKKDCAYPAEKADQLFASATQIAPDQSKLDESYEQKEGESSYENGFVKYLNTLSNATAGNENAMAESHYNNIYFDKVKAHNPIESFLYDELNKGKNILLTGNAGDGKTTIAFNVLKEMAGLSNYYEQRIEFPEKDLVLIKDMSEIEKQKQVNIINEALNNKEKTYFIVSNTGTLINSFKKAKNGDDNSAYSEILNALAADKPTSILSDQFLLINIGRMNSIQTAVDVFKNLLNMDNWDSCIQCNKKESCPILKNVKFIRERKEIAVNRIALIYRRLFEYGNRLTMRQMVGHLAYSITSGLSCADIQAMSQTALEDCSIGALLFNRFFGDDGYQSSPEAMQLMPVRLVRESEFGTLLDPRFERKIWMKAELEKLMGDFTDGITVAEVLLEKAHNPERKQLRRLAYFFGALDDLYKEGFITKFLRSPMLEVFIDYTQEGKIPALKEELLRKKVLHVLQEYFSNTRLPEENFILDELYITLSSQSSNKGTQVVLADFKASDFHLSIKPMYQIGSQRVGLLNLSYDNGLATLILDLPFLDYVAQRYEGELAQGLSAYYKDRLERFKVSLLESSKASDKEVLKLLMIGADRKFSVTKIILGENSLEVLS